MFSLTCKRAAELLSASTERGLTLGERLRLGLHLRACAACARYKAQLRALGRAVVGRARRLEEQKPGSDAPALADDARERLKQSLRDAERVRPVAAERDARTYGATLKLRRGSEITAGRRDRKEK